MHFWVIVNYNLRFNNQGWADQRKKANDRKGGGGEWGEND